MRTHVRAVRYAAAAVLALGLVGCGGDDEPAPAPAPRSSAPTPPQEPEPSGSPEASEPTAPTAGELEWRPVPGSVRDTVTRNADWTLTVVGNGRGWSLDGPDGSTGDRSPDGRVSDALLDERWAVVVLQDPTESRPSAAQVTELATGDTFTIDGSSDVPTTNGGTWTLADDRLLHATVGPNRSYCLAEVDLASRESTLGWCAPKRHGFNGARIAPGGTSLLSFDSGRISCRTLMAIDGGEATAFDGVEDCTAWDGLLTDDGQVWSVIPNERRIEDAHFHATADGEETDLGPGTAGSLVWCGGAAYFTRDPQRDDEPAALVRWTAAEGASVVYEIGRGRAFLSAPRCGGDQLTLTALSESGDEQVTAALR